MYYASIGALSIIIHCIINFDFMCKDPEKKESDVARSYRIFLKSVLCYYVSDVCWGFFYGNRWVTLTFIDTILYFTSMVLSVLLWTKFVVIYLNRESLFNKVLIYGGWIIFLFQIIIIVINLFVPVAFYFGADKEYHPCPGRYSALILQIILFFMTAVYSLTVAYMAEGKDKQHHRTIGFTGIVMTVFIILQALYPLLPFYAVGCLVGTCLVHSFVYRDKILEQAHEMGATKRMAYKDALTGVKNKLAYVDTIQQLEDRIEGGEVFDFGIAVFDVNGLKKINDTKGHDAGDDCIRKASNMICQRFKHSPVFRVGGDEFVAILEGEDYADRDALFRLFEYDMEDNLAKGKVVVSSGFDIFHPGEDDCFSDVFKRADRKMYERKEFLKNL